MCFVVSVNVTFFYGFLTPELVKLGLSENQAGYAISVLSFFYLFGCILLPIVGGKLPRKLLFTAGAFGLSFCMLIMGPSKFFNFPVDIKFVLSAYPLLGICQTLMYLPILPEMIERL